ncbi:hypothetical protein SDC9_93881 [bioreactor metagenome]|uniref:SLH domain-containing protein n=1 Tax=bioreactor metagenome TaxID=1076179 RepID=A0A645A8I5_9ZZZZ
MVIRGVTSSYNGERQIAVTNIRVVDDSIQALPSPISVTTAQAAAGSSLGSLVRVTGTVTRFTASNGVVESIYIRDGSGVECRVFIDGYITKSKTIANLAAGASLTATGLSSIDTEGARIRIRDRADIVCTPAQTTTDSSDGSSSTVTPAQPVQTTAGGGVTTASVSLTGTVHAATGTVTTSVSQTTAQNLLDQAKKAEQAGQRAVIELGISGAAGSSVQVALPGAALQNIAAETAAELRVSTHLGVVSFDAAALDAIGQQAAASSVSIQIAKLETEELPEAARQAAGDRPVYRFTISAGGSTVSSFGGGSATVSLPYTPASGEDLNAIVVYYVDAAGSLQTVRGSYNAQTSTVNFVTTHFSTYMIGYNKVAFSDVADTAWYRDAVSFVAARGITLGVGENRFAPELSLTRGQFIVMLMRAYGISPDDASSDNFADAGSTYYTPYLSAAKRLGITQGTGGNLYGPDQFISRQELFTLTYRTLCLLNELPSATARKQLSDFSDAKNVAEYALEAIQALVDSGVISGSDGRLNPDDISSRAQMAKILYQLLSL